jgi:hypothetical protein
MLMDTSHPVATDQEAWAAQVAALLKVQRGRADEFVADQQRQLDEAEAIIARGLQRLEEEVGRLSSENAELRRQLCTPRPTADPAQHSTRLDWESEKRRLLAVLEADSEDGDKNPHTQRTSGSPSIGLESCGPAVLRAAETMAPQVTPAMPAEPSRVADAQPTTEQVPQPRKREIRPPEQRLEELNRNLARPIAPTSSTEPTIDNDAAVRAERERLRSLQDQWREKLRQAEVELALERAKMARERAEFVAQARVTEKVLPESPGRAEGDRTASGRWWAHLGLTGADREPGRD